MANFRRITCGMAVLLSLLLLFGFQTVSTSTSNGGIAAYAVDGLSFTYVGSGYTAGERVAAWFQSPGETGADTAHALSDVYADAAGNVSFTFAIGKKWEFRLGSDESRVGSAG